MKESMGQDLDIYGRGLSPPPEALIQKEYVHTTHRGGPGMSLDLYIGPRLLNEKLTSPTNAKRCVSSIQPFQ